MLTTRYKTARYRNTPGSGDDLHLHSIEVLPFAGTESPVYFSLQQFTPADADFVAHRQGKANKEIPATTVEFPDE
jgi:hypothetical protein